DLVKAGYAGTEQKVPFFVRLNRYRDKDSFPLEWLQGEWAARYPDLPSLTELLAEGRLVLLCDGLNEIPHVSQTEYRQLIGRWSDFLDVHLSAGNRALFTCRSLDYSATFSERCQLQVEQVQVEPLSHEKILAFLAAYRSEALASYVWAQIGQDEKQLAIYATPFFLKLLIDQLDEAGTVPEGRAELMTAFLRQTLYRELVKRENRFLEASGVLDDDDIEQIERRSWGRSVYTLPENGPLIPVLVSLAYQMQAGVDGEASWISLPKSQARQALPAELARDRLRVANQLNILTEEEGQTGVDVRFAHQLFQEYFAARQLAQQPEPDRVQVNHLATKVATAVQLSYLEEIAKLASGQPVPALATTGWEETTLLAVEMTQEPEAYVRALLKANLPLASRSFQAVSAGSRNESLLAELQSALADRLGDEAFDVRARIAAGLALGELGDPRFAQFEGPRGGYLLPKRFVPFAAGSYLIGDDNGQYADEKPAHQVEIKALEMAAYPVTNAEFRCFMVAGGYEDEQWWETEAALGWLRGETTSEGNRNRWRGNRERYQSYSEEQIRSWPYPKADIDSYIRIRNWSAEEFENWLESAFPVGVTYRHPAQWENSRFNVPNQPVVGICWHEARAYCAWLTAQTGQCYTLPTEAEWEAAARNQRPDAYLYGPEYLLAGGNSVESHLMRTTPVAVFPAGASPGGLYDLSGNVWEWTLSLWGEDINVPAYVYPYRPDDGREDIEAADKIRRVVRGGSWYADRDFARVAYRFSLLPN
ncbi:MAG: SUMF1/EgtB/PvdO family nonheme iron enzyme, partial [Anaerolineales bacterium]|nr:SUMF1/EgtB/PvdO family nonheme iron enzyme [Anaerolineales bacterium]